MLPLPPQGRPLVLEFTCGERSDVRSWRCCHHLRLLAVTHYRRREVEGLPRRSNVRFRTRADVGFWRIPEVLPAVFDGRLRLQSGFWEVVQARVYGVPALILCGQLHRPNVFQDSPKIRLRRKAHGSIRVQEGEAKVIEPMVQWLACDRDTEIAKKIEMRIWSSGQPIGGTVVS
jgi:hypothetical protein